MPFLKSVVFLDVMQIVSPDDNCALHFHACNNACQNTATDAHISCERAFLVNICSLDGLWKRLNMFSMLLQVHVGWTIRLLMGGLDKSKKNLERYIVQGQEIKCLAGPEE